MGIMFVDGPSEYSLPDQIFAAYRRGKTASDVRKWISANITVFDRDYLRREEPYLSERTRDAFDEWMGVYDGTLSVADRDGIIGQVIREAQVALSILPDDAGDIHQTLKYAGIKGVRCNPCHCAISNYIRRATGAVHVSTGGDRVTVDGVTVELPENVRRFIVAFDDGKCDDIADANARGLFWRGESV